MCPLSVTMPFFTLTPTSLGWTRESHCSSASTSRWICSSVLVSDMNPPMPEDARRVRIAGRPGPRLARGGVQEARARARVARPRLDHGEGQAVEYDVQQSAKGLHAVAVA